MLVYKKGFFANSILVNMVSPLDPSLTKFVPVKGEGTQPTTFMGLAIDGAAEVMDMNTGQSCDLSPEAFTEPAGAAITQDDLALPMHGRRMPQPAPQPAFAEQTAREPKGNLASTDLGGYSRIAGGYGYQLCKGTDAYHLYIDLPGLDRTAGKTKIGFDDDGVFWIIGTRHSAKTQACPPNKGGRPKKDDKSQATAYKTNLPPSAFGEIKFSFNFPRNIEYRHEYTYDDGVLHVVVPFHTTKAGGIATVSL